MIIKQVKIRITPEELAREFCNMHSEDQARVFNAMAAEIKKWNQPFCFQLSILTEDPDLTDDGRLVMREIGEYSTKHDKTQVDFRPLEMGTRTQKG